MSIKHAIIFSGLLTALLACQIEIPNVAGLGNNPGGNLANGNGNGGGGGNSGGGGSGGGGGGGGETDPGNGGGGGGGGGGSGGGGGTGGGGGGNTPQTIDFVIQPNTGGNDWNTAATAVVARVGDLIRIRNMDSSTTHELHMPNNGACPHGNAAIPTGGTYDCRVTRAFVSDGQSPEAYDHLRSTVSNGVRRGVFYVRTTN